MRPTRCEETTHTNEPSGSKKTSNLHTLTIEQPRFWGFGKKRRTVTLPETYDELSPQQFRAIVIYSKGWITEIEFFSLFFEIPMDEMTELPPFVAYKLNQTLAFLRNLTPVNKMLIDSVGAIIGKRHLKLMPPGPKLSGMTFQQFMTVDTFFAWYIYSSRTEYLYNFITTLYTDPGIPFDAINTDIYRQAILDEPDNTRELMECIVVNWMLIKQWLSKAYPRLFPPMDKQPDSGGSQSGKKPRPSSWLPVFDALVDEDFTRINSYQALPAIDVLRIINRKIDNQKKSSRK